MNQLTIGTVLAVIKELKESGMSTKEISALPIYIGRDDELNGIHTAWYGQVISSDNADDEYFIEMINEDHCNIKFNKKAFLIS